MGETRELIERPKLSRIAKLVVRIHREGYTASWHKAEVIRELRTIQGNRCAICGEYLRPAEISLDHVVPKARGGRDSLDNFLLTHERCNQDKRDRPASAFQTDIHTRVLGVIDKHCHAALRALEAEGREA